MVESRVVGSPTGGRHHDPLREAGVLDGCLEDPLPMALTFEEPSGSPLPVPGATTMAAHRIRRCHYRRLAVAERPRDHVECLFPDRQAPIVLGDWLQATAACNACKVPTAFRDDED